MDQRAAVMMHPYPPFDPDDLGEFRFTLETPRRIGVETAAAGPAPEPGAFCWYAEEVGDEVPDVALALAASDEPAPSAPSAAAEFQTLSAS